MLFLRTLGAIDLRDSGSDGERPTLVDHPKRLALFVYLAREPGTGHQRDSLLATFWPDSAAPKAKNALRQSLHVIRQSLGPEVLMSDRSGCVRLDASMVVSDVQRFHEAVLAGQGEEALALYTGDFLPGFHLKRAPEFEHWVDNERSGARRLAGEVAAEIARRRERSGDYLGSLRFVRRARELSPFNERLARRHIELLARGGDSARAMEEYITFRDRLASELGVQPSAETVALARRVRRPWRGSRSHGAAGVQ